MSLLDELKKKSASAGTASATEAQKKAATSTQTQVEEDVASFEITEAEIKQNPAYQIVSNTQKSQEQQIKELIALKAYNKDLTAEENAKNLKAFNQFLLHVENQLLATAKKSKEFTNDEAFSMYDEAVQKLKRDLDAFKGNLVPMVKAMEVLQKARDAKIPAGALLDEVKSMKDSREKMTAEIQAKQDALQKAIDGRAPIEAEASSTANRLTELETIIENAKTAKASAEGTRDAENAKYMWSRDKKALTAALDAIKTSDEAIRASTRAIDTLSATAQVTAPKLERQETAIAAIEAELKVLQQQATELDTKLTADEDTAAISKLLEITGKDYKENRGKMSETVDSLLNNSVESFDKSMGRFQSGGSEISAMRNAVVNIGGMIDLCAKADAKVRIMDADYIAEQESTVKRIKEEKGPEAIYDPAYEVAKEQQDQATRHAKESLTLASRTGELDEKLTRQEGTYTGLADAFRQKFMDAQRLRTNAAVEVSSKLLITTKSLELAIASENTGTVDDMLSDLSATTNKATTDLFNTLSRAKSDENDRMAAALKQTIDTVAAIDAVTADLKQKTKEGIVTREAMRQVREELGTLNEGLASVPTNAEREAQQEGLQAAGEKEAVRIAGATQSAPRP